MIRLPYVVEVQERVEEANDEGDTVFTYRAVGTRFADVEPVKSYERVQATAVQGIVSHRVTLRNGGRALRPKDRLLHKGKTYEVDGVVPELRKPGRQVATVVEVV